MGCLVVKKNQRAFSSINFSKFRQVIDYCIVVYKSGRIVPFVVRKPVFSMVYPPPYNRRNHLKETEPNEVSENHCADVRFFFHSVPCIPIVCVSSKNVIMLNFFVTNIFYGIRIYVRIRSRFKLNSIAFQVWIF